MRSQNQYSGLVSLINTQNIIIPTNIYVKAREGGGGDGGSNILQYIIHIFNTYIYLQNTGKR